MSKINLKKIAVTVALSFSLLTGCGAKNADHATGAELNKMLNEIGTAVVEKDSSLSDMTVDTSDSDDAELNFTAVCSVDYDRVDGYYHAYANDGTAGEVTIICAKSNDDVTAIMNALKDHIDSRRGTMENYTPEQVEIVDRALLTHNGCYIGLFISTNSSSDKSNFNAELKNHGIQ